MRQQLHKYTFDTVAKTITLSADYGSISLDRVLLIVNGTTNTFLYNFADSTVGTAVVAGSVITLSVSMAGMANTDNLLIWYDLDIAPTPTSIQRETATADITTQVLLRGLLKRIDLLCIGLLQHYEVPDELSLGDDPTLEL